MRIGPKLILLIEVLVISCVLATGFIYYFIARNSLEERLGAQLESIAILKKNQFNDFINKSIDGLEGLAHDKLLIKEDNVDNKIGGVTDINNSLKEGLVYRKNFFEFFIINQNRQVYASTDKTQIGKFKSGEPYFNRGKEGTFVQSFYYDASLQQPAITISTPINYIADRTTDILAGRVDLNKISTIMTERSGLGETGETYLVSKFNMIMSETKGQKETALKRTIYTDGVKNCLKGNDGYSLYNNYGDIPVIGFYTWIPEREICLLAEINQQEAFEPLRKIREVIILISFGIIILIFLLALFISKKITGPMIALRDAAIKIGKGNLDVKIEKGTKDEIGDLAKAFSQMAKDLKESKIELEVYAEDLELEKARLTASINSLPMGFILLDSEYQVFLSNEYLSDLLEFKNKKSFSFKDIEDKLKNSIDLKIFCEKSASSGKIIMTDNVKFASKSLKLFFAPVMSADKAAGIAILIENITQEKLLDEARNSFIAIAAHELRTPLTIIRGNSELLLEPSVTEKTSAEDSKEMIQSIHKSSIRLLGIINDFLDISTIESGKVQFHVDTFELSDAVKEVADSLKPQADLKNLFLKFSPPERAESRVVADRERTKQIIMNLISNALQYTDKGGVAVEISKENGFAKISISDTGIGIKPEQQEMLFQKFQTVNGRFMHSKEYGSGMGLYISKLLIESMKGSVALEKSSPNEGSVFVIRLPLA